MARLAIEMMENDNQRKILQSISAPELNREAYNNMNDDQKRALNITPPKEGSGLQWGSAKLAHSLLSTLETGAASGESESTFHFAIREKYDDPYKVVKTTKLEDGSSVTTLVNLEETTKAMARIRARRNEGK